MRFPSAVFLLAWVCVASPALRADEPQVVAVWPGGAPDESGDIGAEHSLMSPKLEGMTNDE